MMGCSSRTVSCRICEFDLHAYTSFSDIEDQFVDMAVQDIQRKYPNWGEESIQGNLHSAGIRIQSWRVRDSLHRVSPVSVKERYWHTICRREYRVP